MIKKRLLSDIVLCLQSYVGIVITRNFTQSFFLNNSKRHICINYLSILLFIFSFPLLTFISFQSKSMCGQHIRVWLKRRNLFNKRLGLQRLHSVANLPGNTAVCDVFVQLEALAVEMEKRHPKLYTGKKINFVGQ